MRIAFGISNRLKLGWAITLVVAASLACAQAARPGDSPGWRPPAGVAGSGAITLAAPTPLANQPVNLPAAGTPTPDDPHPLPTFRTEPDLYVVQGGDTLGTISERYGVTLEQVVAVNQLANPNILEVGQILTIPVPTPGLPGPAFKVIPDSELVYGPSGAGFELGDFILTQGGYLATYQEEIAEGQTLSGAEIVAKVAESYSVGPRLLLAVLEYQSGWVTDLQPAEASLTYPLGVIDYRREGLYRQLTWSANQLNLGYYLWMVNGTGAWLLGDGSVVPVDPTINAGTAGIQQLYAPLYDRGAWTTAVTADGLQSVYRRLFGDPFLYAVEPLVPGLLLQPEMWLPFEPGVDWAFTGGPHSGWDSGSAWAALDFAPPGDMLGCVPSNDWVTAVADGMIVRAGDGAVIQDLDGDGKEQTGWAVLYMHIESRDRVQPGVQLKAGERIGHPSCEGGFSSGTHVHLARKYNGEWIPADQNLPFVLDGWISRGTGNIYDGFLVRDSKAIEAWEGRSPENIIRREP